VRDWLDQIILYRNTGAVADQFDYYYTDANGFYDAAGRIRREATASTGVTHAFAYDNLSQLIAESAPDVGTVSYQYDPADNRTRKTKNGVTDYYGYYPGTNKLWWVNQGTNAAPSAGQMTPPYTLFSYDSVGRATQRDRRYTSNGLRRVYDFSWDGDDRLRAVKESGANRLLADYDGDGIRLHKWDNWTSDHYYSWGPGGLLTDSNDSAVYTPGLAQRTTSLGDRFTHSDWLGSTRYTSDSTGFNLPGVLNFDAFGNRSSTGGVDPLPSTPFEFAGAWGYQREYETASEPGVGLQYLEQRYYDAAVGRFISPDPIGFAGGLNLYGYVADNPVGGVDPSGLQGGEERDPLEEAKELKEFEEELGRHLEPAPVFGRATGAGARLARARAILSRVNARNRALGRAIESLPDPEGFLLRQSCDLMRLAEEVQTRVPVHPRFDRFYVRADELLNAANVRPLHPIYPEQMRGSPEVGHGGVSNLSNAELLKFGGPKGNDPISGFRSYPRGGDYSRPGPLINIRGGHHRLEEIRNRVLNGGIPRDTLIEFKIAH
jgi:RHS repeat-associated protein